MKNTLTTTLTLLALLATPTTAHAAAAPMIIEQSQAQQLPAAMIPTGSFEMTEHAPFPSGVEHYTRTVGCGWRRFTYVAQCLSLEQSPPPSGSTAIYDPEAWALTSTVEHADYCAGMRLARRLTTAAGARLWIAPPTPTQQKLVQCAARNARTIILQAQPYEATTASYMHVLRRAARWARAVRPRVQIAFVLSTASRYGASSASLVADYTEAEAYLGGGAAWWLNIIPDRVAPAQPVITAEALLASAGA